MRTTDTQNVENQPSNEDSRKHLALKAAPRIFVNAVIHALMGWWL